MQTAVERARTGLCRMIAAGELALGEALPSEAELCERFDVSRSSLREAQKMLVVAGALIPHDGGRTTVSLMTPEQILSGLSMVLPLLPLERMLELFTLREVLEGHCAAQAAARISDERLTQLRDVAGRLRSLPPGYEAQLLDGEFHNTIIEAAGDPMITALLDSLRRRGREFRIYEHPAHADLKAISDAAHDGLLEAIANREPEAARALAVAHIRTTRAWLEEFRPDPELFSPTAHPPVAG